MKLHRPVLAALALTFALPLLVGTAHGKGGPRLIYGDIGVSGEAYLTWKPRLVVVTSGDDSVASVGAELTSDAGTEDLTLIESNATLHGAATIPALPAADADVTVTLYDTGSAALMSFSGTLGADGSVTLAADNGKYDIELLAAEAFTAEKGYDVGVDLAGADTYAVAYATVTVTEGGAVCLVSDEKGNCLKWDTSKEVSTRSEVYWDDIGSVWEADTTLAHEGLVEVKVTARDSNNKKIETAKAKLGAPWLDDGEGVGTLATDEDPLTTVAMHRPRYHRATTGGKYALDLMTVVSEGWTAGGDLPVDAEVELTNGKTITIPVNSYQRARSKLDVVGYAFDRRVLSPKARIAVVGDDAALEDLSLEDLRTPACTESTCFVLVEDEAGEFALSATRYGADAGALPDAESFTLSVTDELGEESWTVDVEYADEITAVFSNEVTFASDPVGLGLSGKVSLLGAPNRKGKQDTLAKGKFYAELARDGDGDLELAGGDKDTVVSSGNAVLAGEAIGLDDGQGGLDTPPVIAYGLLGNGSGGHEATDVSLVRRSSGRRTAN